MRTVGRVSWFDPATGEGAVVSEGGVLAALTRAVLAPLKFDALMPGAAVDCEVALTAGGLAVTEIFDVTGAPAEPGQLCDLPPRHGPLRVKGRVLWFHPNKGFGFVWTGDVDALLHQKVLAAAGLQTIGQDAVLDCDAVRTIKGFSVTRIHAVLEPGAPPMPFVEPPPPLPWKDGICRWYSRPRGYGVVTLTATREEVFVRGSALRRGGLRAIAQAQRVCVQAEQTPRGLMAVAVARPSGAA